MIYLSYNESISGSTRVYQGLQGNAEVYMGIQGYTRNNRHYYGIAGDYMVAYDELYSIPQK